jgi:hypothetical protein
MYQRQTTSSIARTVFVPALTFYALSITTVMAETIAIDSSDAESTAAAQSSLTQPETVSCPSAFHAVTITDDATQCQQFETQVPAAMIYHTKQQPRDVVAFYRANMSTLTVHAPVNQRTLLTSDNNRTRIVISPDNTGAQVDILVTPKPNS